MMKLGKSCRTRREVGNKYQNARYFRFKRGQYISVLRSNQALDTHASLSVVGIIDTH
jgi:hypothetical protein